MSWPISRRTVLGSLAAFVPAAHAQESLSLKEQDGDVVLLAGTEALWRVMKSGIIASLGSAARVREQSPDKLRIENGALLGNVACRLDVILLRATSEISFAIGFGGDSTTPLGRISVGRIKDAAWLADSLLGDGHVRRLLREKLGPLDFYSGPRLGIDQALSIFLRDPKGMTLRPSPLSYQTLRLLPDHARAVWIRGQPLAAADKATGGTLQFSAGTWRGTTLKVTLPRDRGEAVIFEPAKTDAKGVNRGAHAVLWRAPNTEASDKLILELRAEAGASNFPAAPGAGVVWSYSRSGETQTELEWVLPNKPFALKTQHGRFTVSSWGPDVKPAPWPALLTEAAGEELKRFEASALLTNYGIKLPGADLGRLDFDYATCAFRLSDCPGATADSVIYLAPPRVSGVDWVSLSLDRASLRVLRAKDHLSVTFKFRHIKLKKGMGAPHLAPDAEAVLVAELPPQHIAEQTFARQLPLLPGLTRDLPTKEDLVAARAGGYRERKSLRKALDDGKGDYDNLKVEGFDRFAKAFEEAVAGKPTSLGSDIKLPPNAANMPDAVWLGPDFIRTVWARRLARAVAADVAAASKEKAVLPPLPNLDDVPDFFGKKLVAWDLIQRESGSDDFPNRAVTAIIDEAVRVSDEQRILQEVYRAWRDGELRAKKSSKLAERFITKDSLKQLQDWLLQQPVDAAQGPRVSAANEAARQNLGLAWSSSGKLVETIREDYWKEQQRQGTDELQGNLPVLARLSGFSRLAFTFREMQKDASPPRFKSIDFTATALCNWDGFDLKVARRAKLFPPAKSADAISDALKLRGITQSNNTAQRLKDIIEATTAPSESETAIELPFRLILSPAENATFKVTSSKPTSPEVPQPLWQATLDQGSDSLRAIWSEDFWADKAFPPKGKKPGEPPRGPWAPWQLRRDLDDPVEANAPRFRATLDAFDRHQLVGLTSVFGLPVIPRRGPDGRTLHPTQLVPPPAYELHSGVLRADEVDQALYYPQTLTGPVLPDAKPGTIARPYLALSAAGGFLEVDTNFTPPAALRWADTRSNLFNAFSLGRWQQKIVQGADVFAEVEYVGFLMPTAHQATLVKLSERVNLLPTSPLVPTSYLVQRHFIRVAKEKNYNPAEAPSMPMACRAWPATKITMRGSLRTPDLVDPSADRAKKIDIEHPGGRIEFNNSTGLIFWPRTVRNPNYNVQFTFSIDDAQDVVQMPMIFVDNQAAHDAETIKALYAYYNGFVAAAATKPTSPAKRFVASEPLRTLEHRGALRRYALPRKPGDTSLETVRWLIGVDCRNGYLGEDAGFSAGVAPTIEHFMMDSTLESGDQPPFYPRLEKATVHLQTIAGLAQTAQPESAFRYLPNYLTNGFTVDDSSSPPQHPSRDGFTVDSEAKARQNLSRDTFFQVAGDRPVFDMASHGDRAGGVGRPSQKIVGLARVGPVGNAAEGDGNKFGTVQDFGRDFFDKSAKLLGLVSLQELIGNIVGLSAPLLQERLLYSNDNAVFKAIETLRPIVKGLREKLTPVQVIYPSGFDAIVRLETALNAVKQTPADEAISTVTEVAAAALQVKAELEAIASAPLAQLSEIAQKQITDLSTRLRAAVAAPPFDVLPSDLVIRLMPLDFQHLVNDEMTRLRSALIAAGESRQAVDAKVSALRPKLTAFGREMERVLEKSLTNAFLGPVPDSLRALRQQIAESVKRQIDVLASPVLPEVPSAVGDLKKLAQRLVDDAVNEVVPQAVDRLYLSVVHAIAGDVGGLRAFVSALSGQLTTDVCVAATTVIAALRPFILPPKDVAASCTFTDDCPPPASTSNFCQPIWQAICALYQTAEKNKADFVERSRKLAERFNTLVALVNGLPDPINICDPRTVSDWRQVQRARNAFSDEMAEWAASAAILLNDPNLSPPSIQGELAGHLAHATAGAIDMVAPIAIGTNAAIDAPYQVMRNVRKELGANSVSADLFSRRVSELKANLEQLRTAALKAAEERLSNVVLPSVTEVAKAVPIIARGLGAWYDMVTIARDETVRQAKVLEQKVPQLNIVADFNLETGKDLQDERLAITEMERATTEAVRLEKLVAYLDKVQADGGFAPVRLIRQVGDRINKRIRDAAANEIMKLVDIGQTRKDLEEQLKSLSPLKRMLNYRYELPLQDVDLDIIAFKPDGGNLTLTSDTEVDIANGNVTSSFSGKTDRFVIDIGKGGEFLKLKFGAFVFSGGSGRATTFDAPLQGVVIGAKMAFLVALAAFMGSGGDGDKPRNGPYIKGRSTGPGIVAGFRLGFDVFSIGAMGFANVFFDAHCELPFDAAASVVRLSLSSRESPMTIFYGVYGGSAHFQIEGDHKGTRRVDISLEFGGAQAISYGPLSGIGRVMTGIQVSRSGGSGTLTALFTADFVGHIACFGIAACFSVSMVQGDGGVSGSAVLTYAFSCGPAKIKFNITVFRRQANAGSKEKTALLVPINQPKIMLAQASGLPPIPALQGLATTMAISPRHDWKASRDYYSSFPNAMGKRRRVS